MELNEFQTQLQNFGDYPHALGPYFTILGITSNTGKLSDKLANYVKDPNKHGFTDTEKNLIAMSIGDILFWCLNMAADLKISFNDIAALELRKLSAIKEQNSK